MNRSNRIGYALFGLLALVTIFSLVSMLAWADNDVPYGVRNVTFIQTSRSNVSAYPPAQFEAEAGNVTEIDLTTISTTKGWQGYYGNVSGMITLEDSDGYVFYNWTAAEPKGEIFASTNNTINWTSVACFNWTGQTYSLEDEEAIYGFGDDSSDGINETYVNVGLNSDIFVGSLNITSNATAAGLTCHTTNPFRYGLENSSVDDFENVLLMDAQGALIYMAVIENNEFNNMTDINGYDNQPHDFQLLVAENGFDGFEDTSTTYYFWAEIE